MSDQLKKDVRTIIEVLLFLIACGVTFAIYHRFPWLCAGIWIISIFISVYRKIFLKRRKDIIMLPTQNDESSKMSLVAFSLIVLFFSSVGHFAFDMEIYQAAIGLALGGGLIWFGLYQSPKGWLLAA